MGVKSVKVHCDKRSPPEKHHWQKGGTSMSGVNERVKYKCSKCGRTTIRDDYKEETSGG